MIQRDIDGGWRAVATAGKSGGLPASTIENRSIASAATSFELVAEVVAPDKHLILAICDDDGRATDLLVRDREGRVAVQAGLAEDERPDLGAIVALPGDESSGEVDETAGRGAPPPSRHVQELFLRTLIENPPVPLLLADRDGIVVYASVDARELGYTGTALVGHLLQELAHPGDRERLARALAPVARGETSDATIEVRWQHGDGGYASVEARIRAADGLGPQPAHGGVVVGLRPLAGAWTGIGDLVAAGHRQRTLADASDAGVAIVSGAEKTLGAVLEGNVALGRLVGATTGQLVGTTLTSLVAAHDAARLQESLKAIAADGGQRTLEVTLASRVGPDRLAKVTITPERDAERGELIVRMRDVTEQLRVVDELSRMVDRLELANQELAEFARITAHDLGAPLVAVSRLVDLISDSGADPDFTTLLAAIRSAIGRMHTMVDGVMGYTDSLETTTERTPVNMDEAVQRVLDVLAEEIGRREARITRASLPTVHGNEHQLERVLLNLIANALKFGGESPHLRLEANREQGAWRISVTDSGIGVPEEQRARIFELFAGGDRHGAGRGIGLATSRRIVELHGGRIWVEPNQSDGSTFHFTLPDEPNTSSAADRRRGGASTGRLRRR